METYFKSTAHGDLLQVLVGARTKNAVDPGDLLQVRGLAVETYFKSTAHGDLF